MKNFKYLIQFLLVISLLLIFKILGPKLSSYLSGKIFELIGPLFRSKKLFIQISKEHFQQLARQT